MSRTPLYSWASGRPSKHLKYSLQCRAFCWPQDLWRVNGIIRFLVFSFKPAPPLSYFEGTKIPQGAKREGRSKIRYASFELDSQHLCFELVKYRNSFKSFTVACISTYSRHVRSANFWPRLQKESRCRSKLEQQPPNDSDLQLSCQQEIGYCIPCSALQCLSPARCDFAIWDRRSRLPRLFDKARRPRVCSQRQHCQQQSLLPWNHWSACSEQTWTFSPDAGCAWVLVEFRALGIDL